MSISSQHYAFLADDTYKTHKKNDKVIFEGVTYDVLEQVENRITGYQGTIYQCMDAPYEIVAAHRGTEMKSGLLAALQDGVLADGGMVIAQVNAQSEDAMKLTRRALEYAEELAPRYGGHAPRVTVTGHSLGGCHAEVTSHAYNLGGETFNAYGAVSLNRRIPEEKSNLINHVMAADPVSAASRHFGEVRVYATPGEMLGLHQAGYDSNRNPLQHRNMAMAVYSSIDSHYMDNFLNVDGNNKPDKSVLADSQARDLAKEFDPAIDRYRSDVALARGLITFAARDPLARVMDGLDSIRGPLPKGGSIRLHGQVDAVMTWDQVGGLASPHIPLPLRAPAYSPQVSQPGGAAALPEYLTRPKGQLHPPLKWETEAPPPRGIPLSGLPSSHPDYALYSDLKQRLPSETSEERLMQITVAAKLGGVKAGQVDRVDARDSPLEILISGTMPGDRCRVDISGPPPSSQESRQSSVVFDHIQTQPLAMRQAPHGQSHAPHGVGMS